LLNKNKFQMKQVFNINNFQANNFGWGNDCKRQPKDIDLGFKEDADCR